MRIAWTILLISALTDGLVAAGGAIAAASTETSWVPGKGAMVVAILTGVVAGARTIQQALKTVKLKVDLAGNLIETTSGGPA